MFGKAPTRMVTGVCAVPETKAGSQKGQENYESRPHELALLPVPWTIIGRMQANSYCSFFSGASFPFVVDRARSDDVV